ncbi:methyl-accepting chemotaxis sensory transducer with Pas/Pac sensor [Phreatobacter oligotrophus]|uniref:Methyl-accepting chemotaxis sensory transducer with Pas/Pac sensor n=2 Tax=Phreatobacter oligotrophus TaxID=1122261 RepID=A0A2T4YS47_9HYPH|nr:methyl-accepting chemotaxis sensory transducer with Pas/Pac sensor [Phreatobacter oligotrophus]
MFLDLLGYSLNEVLGKQHSSITAKQDAEKDEQTSFWNTLKNDKFFISEILWITKNGQEIWLQGSYNVVFKSRKPYKVVMFATNISLEKKERVNLESKIEAINRSQASIEYDRNGEIVAANTNFLKLMDYNRDEIVGRHHRLLIDSTEAETPEYATFWKRLRSGRFHSGEFRFKNKKGQDVWIHSSYNPLFGIDDNVSGVLQLAVDITAMKQASIAELVARNQILAGIPDIAAAVTNTHERAASAAAAAVETSNIVNSVAAGSSQLSTSVQEINGQVSQALSVSDKAVQQARQVSETVLSLVDNSKKISAVIEMISSIAGQTNLLALNATIEAARAGESGRGFAVVASEVKSLSSQTAKATEEINVRIQAVQASSKEVHDAIDEITQTISSINDISGSISAAVEQQSCVAAATSQAMLDAASSVEVITQTIVVAPQLSDAITTVVSFARDAMNSRGER